MVHGAAYADWIQSEFPKLFVHFNKQDQQDQLDSGPKESNKQDQPDSGQKEINGDKGTEIESLWENIDNLANSICTQDSSILDIIRRCQK